MPMYKFRCKECGHQFYRTLEMRKLDDIRPHCPICKSSNTINLMAPVGIQFKGSGWTKRGTEK
jgi:putative FmdB family regulatory protein